MYKHLNNPVKNSLMAAFITLLAFTAVTYISCKKDKCKDMVCQNSGTCSDGTCSCTTGYSGTNCETAANAKFLGTWTGTNCLGQQASLTFGAGSDGATVTLGGSVGLNSCYKVITVSGTVTGNVMVVSSTVYTDLCGNTYSFTGTTATITGNSLHLNLVLNYLSAGGSDTNCFDGTK